jgi:hypothetical protein
MGFRSVSSARTLALLLLCCQGLACLIQPAPLPDIRPATVPLRLIVNETHLEPVVCEAFAGNSEIRCGGPTPGHRKS